MLLIAEQTTPVLIELAVAAVSLAVAVVSAVAALGCAIWARHTALTAKESLTHAKRLTAKQNAFDLHMYLQRQDLVRYRQQIRHGDYPWLPMDSDEAKSIAAILSSMYNIAGFAAEQLIVKPTALIPLYHRSVLKSAEKLASYLDDARQDFGDAEPYPHFRWLIQRSKEFEEWLAVEGWKKAIDKAGTQWES